MVCSLFFFLSSLIAHDEDTFFFRSPYLHLSRTPTPPHPSPPHPFPTPTPSMLLKEEWLRCSGDDENLCWDVASLHAKYSDCWGGGGMEWDAFCRDELGCGHASCWCAGRFADCVVGASVLSIAGAMCVLILIFIVCKAKPFAHLGGITPKPSHCSVTESTRYSPESQLLCKSPCPSTLPSPPMTYFLNSHTKIAQSPTSPVSSHSSSGEATENA